MVPEHKSLVNPSSYEDFCDKMNVLVFTRWILQMNSEKIAVMSLSKRFD